MEYITCLVGIYTADEGQEDNFDDDHMQIDGEAAKNSSTSKSVRKYDAGDNQILQALQDFASIAK